VLQIGYLKSTFRFIAVLFLVRSTRDMKMYEGLARTITVFLCYLLFARASNLRAHNTEDFSIDNVQTETKSKISENLNESETSDDRTIIHEEGSQASSALRHKKNLRKKRDMKYLTESSEQPMLEVIRPTWNGRFAVRDRVGKILAWNGNSGDALNSKTSRDNRAIGRLVKRRICFGQHGMTFCQRLHKPKMGRARHLNDIEFNSKTSENLLAREIYDFEVAALRNKLQSMPQENLQELLKSDDNLPISQVENGAVSENSGGQKRSELSSLVDGVSPHDSKARPQFYPNDGPKRDWKVNLMRVWG